MTWPEDTIDYEPDYYVEAEPFDWDEAIQFHDELRACRIAIDRLRQGEMRLR